MSMRTYANITGAQNMAIFIPASYAFPASFNSAFPRACEHSLKKAPGNAPRCQYPKISTRAAATRGRINLRGSETGAASPEHDKRNGNVDRLMWICACVHASSIRADNDQEMCILLRLCARVACVIASDCLYTSYFNFCVSVRRCVAACAPILLRAM